MKSTSCVHQRAIETIERLEQNYLMVTEIMRVCSHYHRESATRLITCARDITHDELDRINEVIDEMVTGGTGSEIEPRKSKNGLRIIREKLRTG